MAPPARTSVRVSRALASAAAVLVLGACTSSGARTAGPTATPSPSTTVAASATPTPTVAPTAAAVSALVAVERTGGALEIYRVDSARHAARQRLMSRPAADYRPASIAFSAGTDPSLCVLWQRIGHEDSSGRLLCYAPGASVGRPVAGVPRTPSSVALRADGKALAWSESAGEPTYQMDLLVADFDGKAASHLRRIAYDPSCPRSRGEACLGFFGVGALAWVDNGSLALSVGGESDENSGLRIMKLDAVTVAKGWVNGARPVNVPKADFQRRFTAYDNIVSATPATALAIERPNYVSGENNPPARAVRVNLATGAVLEVVATPGSGREAFAVSGDHLVLYVTQSGRGTDRKVYLRLPGEAHGVQVTGLPSGVAGAVVQPL